MSSVPTPRRTSRRHDETRARHGSPLPGWSRVLAAIDDLPEPQRDRRQREIGRLLRANGAAFNPTGEEDEVARPWRLDLVPMVFEDGDWQTLEAGLRQRVKVRQALLADIYGEQSLLSAGVVPPAMVYAHRGYLRDARRLPGSDDLPLSATDVSRSPSGDWYVVDDICQYPAGLGYALENRLVLSRVLPSLFRDCGVQRIAPWFRALQQRVVDAMDRDARCVLLGYGASHRHYFEFALLAKYLGYTLVELGDLTVRDERVYLRTVAGLQRVDVILRFIDDTHADPLAVDNTSRSGVAGLMQAVREGDVQIINPLGSGAMDNPALNACLPAVAKHLFGEKLLLRSAPTYWLGDPDSRAHVQSRFDELLFRDIDSIGRLGDPRLMSGDERASLERDIELVPARFVAQERIDRSFAPGYEDGQRVEHQITVRTFMVGTGDGHELMTGGLCLLDEAKGGRRPSFESLNGSKDVWVLSDEAVRDTTLLRPFDAEAEAGYAMIEGELPSRVAENLFWLGRNAERAETTLRMLRGVCRALQREDAPAGYGSDGEEGPSAALDAMLRTLTNVTGTWPGFVGKGGRRRRQKPDRELISLLHDPARRGSLGYTIGRLQQSAASMRDRMSAEMTRTLNEIEDREVRLREQHAGRSLVQDPDALISTIDGLDALVVGLSAFSGLVHENLTHGDSWRFMMLGRRIERAAQTSTVVRTMLASDRDNPLVLETLLHLLDSIMTYRSRYRTRLDVHLTLQLLALDESNPRAIAYQFRQIENTIAKLPGRRHTAVPDALGRSAMSGVSRVRLADARSLLKDTAGNRQSLGKFLEILESLPATLTGQLSALYFTHTETRNTLGESDGIAVNVTPEADAETNLGIALASGPGERRPGSGAGEIDAVENRGAGEPDA